MSDEVVMNYNGEVAKGALEHWKASLIAQGVEEIHVDEAFWNGWCSAMEFMAVAVSEEQNV